MTGDMDIRELRLLLEEGYSCRTWLWVYRYEIAEALEELQRRRKDEDARRRRARRAIPHPTGQACTATQPSASAADPTVSPIGEEGTSGKVNSPLPGQKVPQTTKQRPPSSPVSPQVGKQFGPEPWQYDPYDGMSDAEFEAEMEQIFRRERPSKP